MTRRLLFPAFLVAVLLGMAVHVATRILERVHTSMHGLGAWGTK